MSPIAIRAANLSKLYHIGRGQGIAGYRTLREILFSAAYTFRRLEKTFADVV
jgi:hypothetical protein